MKKLSLIFALMCLIVLSLSLGHINLFTTNLSEDLIRDIVIDLRLPRTILAIIVGGILGLNGAILQGFLRNPLADASLLGIGSGAAFFAVLCIYGGFSVFGFSTIPLCACMGGMLATFLLYGFMGRSHSSLRLILAGIALNSLFGAMISLSLSLSKDPYAMMHVLFWLFGSYADVPFSQILFFLPFLIAGVWLLWTLGPLLDALSFGEDMAKIMGFSLKRASIKLIIGIGLTTGISVALCGVVGFIGLVTPHIIRGFLGSQPSRLLFPSFMGGAILSLLADIFVRLIPASVELKVGVMTSLIGAPFFVYLLYRSYRAEL